MAKTKARKASFGSVRQLPSGRYQARYTGPDGIPRKANVTFDTKGDAETWLSVTRADIVREAWNPEANRPRLDRFEPYATGWLAARTLAATTREHYAYLLTTHIVPTLGRVPLQKMTPDVVRAWHSTTLVDKPTQRAHAYSLLRTILNQAVGDQIIPSNPCTIRAAGSAKRQRTIRPASLPELEKIVATIPAKYRALVLLGAWCGLRFGELAELRRDDVDVRKSLLRVRRGVVRAGGQRIVKRPKSEAGVRTVAIPPHLMPAVRAHLLSHAAPGADGLVFPAADGGHLAPTTLYKVWSRGRKAAGRPDLRFHDLRHTGAVLAAQTGATLAELMARLGHATPAAAMRYQHAAGDRDTEIARRLSEIAGTAT